MPSMLKKHNSWSGFNQADWVYDNPKASTKLPCNLSTHSEGGPEYVAEQLATYKVLDHAI